MASRYLDAVQSLVDEPTGGELLALSPAVAVLALRDSTLAIVASGRGPADDLHAMLADLVQQTRGADVKLVVVGGGDEQRKVLERLQPAMMIGRTIQALLLDDRGEVWAGARSRVDSPVGRVLKAVGERSEPREVELAELAARVRVPTPEDRQRAQTVQRFVQTTRQGLPHVTVGILGGIVGAFGLEHLWGDVESIPTLYRMGANGSEALGAEPWRLLSHAWLHVGLLHLLVNGYVLYSLGGLIERLLGSARLAVLYVLAALAGGIASATLSDAVISAGASGAIWGLLGASIALAWRPAGLIPDEVLPVVRRNAVVNLMINLAVSFLPAIDLWAHLGGGIAGGLLVLSGAVTRGVAGGAPDASRPWRVLAGASGIAMVGAVVVAIVSGRPWALLGRGEARHEFTPGIAVTTPSAFDAPTMLRNGNQLYVAAGNMLRDRGAILWVIGAHGLALEGDAELDEAYAEFVDIPIEAPEGATAVGERKPLRGEGWRGFSQRYDFGDGAAMTVTFQLHARAAVRVEASWWTALGDGEAELARAAASIELDEAIELPPAEL